MALRALQGPTGGGTPVGGTGTANTIPRWTGPSTLGDSGLIDNGTTIYTTTRNVGVGMTSGFPAKLGVLSANAIGTADLTFSYDATGSYRHGFSNVFSSSAAANNTSTWLVWNAAGGQTQVMTANGAGNLGLGVTLSAWGSSYRAFQMLGTTLGSNSTNGTYYTQNAFFDGANWKYVTTAAANRYQMLLGVHSWHTASSGTAGNNITFTQAMTLDASGNVYAGSGTTGMTDGFFYIAAAAGAPTGTPTAVSGRVPMYYDTTNNKFYIYNGAWKQVALT